MLEEPIEPVDLTTELPAVIALTPADVSGVLEELAAYHAKFAPLFKRPEQRAGAQTYLRGLLTADVPRKNVEAMVLRLFGAGPDADRRVRALQQFIGESPWDDAAILGKHQSLVEESLGEDDGVFIIDGSDFPKQGKHSAGVARRRRHEDGDTPSRVGGLQPADQLDAVHPPIVPSPRS